MKEEHVYKYWTDNDVFNKSIELNKNKNEFVFYDGPPFATGLPHYGHILAGFIKDTILRFQHGLGKNVPRYAGFDVHGLPIEYEIEKDLGIKTTQQILDYGIDNYNESCRSIVLKYANEWEQIMGRLGRWINFKEKYTTMNKDFMNSVWWVISQLYKKNRLYEGVRIMGYSTSCATSLSNFEVQQNYQEVKDDSLFVKLYLKDKFKNFDNVQIIVWTTTPWTLVSNYCLAVGEEIKYNLVEYEENKYICAETLLNNVFKKKEFKILHSFNGKELLDLKYIPPFNFNNFINEFKIISGDFVTDSDGTGIVHIAPAFGEDDYNICIKNNIIQKDSKLFIPINENGYINDLIPDLKGKFYKNFKDKTNQDLNTWSIIELKKNNFYWDKRQYTHNYPFCWRSDTPLIYKAVNSWFIKVDDMREKLVELNNTINWEPKSVGSGRFHNWISNAKDWGISRSRFWGTPIPIWKSEDGDVICIESSYELEKLANLEEGSIKDLHRHHIDQIKIYKDGKTYTRIEEVCDCWLESGSMPYASLNKIGIVEMLRKYNLTSEDIKLNNEGHPYLDTKKIITNDIVTNKDLKFRILPADFIAEGIDQTRGWFYTLLVLSASLYNCIPFKNVIVNGLVLAEDGKKMSKRLKNYPDPMEIVNEYGSDSLRVYLMNSPATRGEPLRFSKNGVHEITKDIIIPLTNSIVFLKEYCTLYYNTLNKNPLKYFNICDIKNPINLWILKQYYEIRNEFLINMNNYNLSNSTSTLFKLVQILNNGYIKIGRYILKGKVNNEEWEESLNTLYCIITFILNDYKCLLPFFCEREYLKLSNFINNFEKKIEFEKSIHFIDQKIFNKLSIDQINYSNDFDIIYNLILNIYQLRSMNKISLKKPIKNVDLIISNTLINNYSDRFKEHLYMAIDECNLINLNIISEDEVIITKDIKPIKGLIFKKHGKEITEVFNELEKLSSKELDNIIENKFFNGYTFEQNMFNIKYNVKTKKNLENTDIVYKEFDYGDNKDKIAILMDKYYDETTDKLYYYRLVATSIQKCRKFAGLHPWDNIEAFWEGKPKYNLEDEIAKEYINNITRINLNKLNENPDKKTIYEETYDNINLKIHLI
jgi:isoleucyl-tRNA synthetase